MTHSYEQFEHTADYGVIGHGTSLGEALAGVMDAMFDEITDRALIREAECREIEATGEGLELEDYIVGLFSKTLTLFETEGFLCARSEIRVLTDGGKMTGLTARLFGEIYDPDRHPIESHIKAVTYHELKVWEDENGWRAKVLFDV